MPQKTIKRRLQDCDAALASDDGLIFSTVAKLLDARKTRSAKTNLLAAREVLRGTKYEEM